MDQKKGNSNTEEIAPSYIEQEIDRWHGITAMVKDALSAFEENLREGVCCIDPGQMIQIDYFKSVHADFMKKLSQYSSSFSVINECDDLQCEDHFRGEYLRLKQDFESLCFKYQALSKVLGQCGGL